jgi:pimeloyl-ACP methyl ester carboxylesterase
MQYEIKQKDDFEFIDEGSGEVMLLLHGLFGGLSNFETVIHHFARNYRVLVPLLPVYTLPVRKTGLKGLVKFVHSFIQNQNFKNVILVGNSLGGHVGLIYALQYPDKTQAIVLTGSSGLFENTMGGSYPKRGDYDYIREKAEYTFYDPKVATKELVDEIYEIVNDRSKALRLIMMSRSAMKHTLRDELPKIEVPVCLIWGKNDKITPPHVAKEFNELLPNSELNYIDKCGHAPMMERPEEFNIYMEQFLQSLHKETAKQ